jgi:hypothetical protein
VKSVNQDLLSGNACNKIGISIIQDESPGPDNSGFYPLDKEKQQHLGESIPYFSEPRDLYLQKNGLEKIP